MDDFTAEMFASGHVFDSPEGSSQRGNNSRDDDDDKKLESDSHAPAQKTGLRGGFAAIRQKANLQDRLVEKYIQFLKCL
jgi:hypothetical protein